jgi:hypothetical protein
MATSHAQETSYVLLSHVNRDEFCIEMRMKKMKQKHPIKLIFSKKQRREKLLQHQQKHHHHGHLKGTFT